MVKSYSHGHEIYFDGNKWLYTDTDAAIDGQERPCKRCGQMPTREGYDACLGHIAGATSACCGHGVENPFVLLLPTTNKPFYRNRDTWNKI